MSIGERLREAREAMGLNRVEAAWRGGLSKESIARYERGERSPDAGSLVRMADVYGVSVGWLVAEEVGGLEEVRTLESVPVLEAMGAVASAGAGGVVGVDWEDQTVAFPRAWLRERRLNGRACCLFRVSGDSMYPAVPEGSLVLVDRGNVELYPGRVYVLMVDGDLVVKRVQRSQRGWSVVSDNPVWEPFEFDRRRMDVVGEVRWTSIWL